MIKYYIANKPDDSDKVVLPSTNIDAYFGNGNFSKKWLPKELDSVIIRDPQSNGVSRYTLHENLISLIYPKVQQNNSAALSSFPETPPTNRYKSPVWALLGEVG